MNEAAFYNLVESLGDAVFVVRLPDRGISYANREAVALFGYQKEELLGFCTRLLHVDETHFQSFHDRSAKVLTGGHPFQGEYEMRKRSGEVFPTHHTVSLFSGDDGQEYAVSVIRDISLQKQQELAIRASEERFRQIAENLREVFWITSPEKNRMEYISPAYESVWGRSIDELYHKPLAFTDAIHPDDRGWVLEAMHHQAEGNYDVRYRITRPDGEERWIWDRCVPITDERGQPYRIVGIAEDITDFKRQQMQLVQAQKMEAIGQLTGGIAHDFNNMLAVINGNAELLVEELASEPGVAALAEGILKAGRRAGDLTGRLLAFSRRQPLKKERVSVNKVIDDLNRLLFRQLGEHISVELALADDLWPAKTHRAELEASLINLVINARDAMPEGGKLGMATVNMSLTAGDGPGPMVADLPPGDYCVITVSDTGQGMTPEVADRVFEPFFTTKELGKGTGMGLSQVFGFARGSGGCVDVQSLPGKGSSFRLILPRCRDEFATGDATTDQGQVPVSAVGGGEPLLVVEDEAMVRDLLATQLRSLGYRVLEADSGAAALGVLAQEENIALLVSDVIMPGGISGPQLAREALSRRPGLKVLFVSGFGAQRELARAGLSGDMPLLTKPFSLRGLADAVRSALDPVSGPTAAG